MDTAESFSWGADAHLRVEGDRPRVDASTRRESMLGARMAATIIDGLVLLIPVLAVAYVFSLAFPHHGFFLVRSGTTTDTTVSGSSSTRYNYTLPLPGLLLMTALSLGYFFVCEALWGRTIGKRTMGLRVRSASGGPAGLNATSARTVLRLIDGIGFYLVGWLVALLTGARRRRIGDWAGGTVVVRDDRTAAGPPRPAVWRVVFYPAMWLAAVMFAVFALGLGTAVGEGEQAIALVQSYVRAREQGDATLACSMLTVAQQRELVAIQSGSYANASAGRCPSYILQSEPHSHLLNPGLVALSESPLSAQYTPVGGVVVYSSLSSLSLIAVPEGGQMKLDMRGVEKLAFVRACSTAGRASAGECECTFDLARSEAPFPEHGLTVSQARWLQADEARCQTGTGATPA